MELIYTYPACFYPDTDGITVIFPDLPGCTTCGFTLDEALYMADDAACGWILTTLEMGEKLPPASKPGEVVADEFANGFVNFMRLDVESYAKKFNKKPVNKNCSIPTWLNTLAERANLNFSQTLQDGIKQRLGLV
ncbi:MAG: type II toxin-antitoxin system HicB family antitoxin [Ruminococcus sp.]|jgi:predicted RNase H-like HicB family nuclease|nr:type II toxin-antitoxin system HicB family antitoxin [Ruminococcus sp.]